MKNAFPGHLSKETHSRRESMSLVMSIETYQAEMQREKK